MLQRLANYQKEIALNLIALMLGSVLLPYSSSANPVRTETIHVSPLPYPQYYSGFGNNAFDKASEYSGLTDKIAPIKLKPVSASSNKEFKSSDGKIAPADVAGTIGKKKPFIGGPSQPEMSGFKSVNADNMVDLFSGDFAYNIPLLDVGGYPVNLFYDGGITMDQQASWVGLGFNINPGTIMRNMRGLPDDFDGTDMVTKTQSMKPDKTWGVNAGAGVEVFGLENLSLDINTGVSFNNQRGIALEAGIHPSINLSAKAGTDKTVSLSFGANLNVNSQSGSTFTPSIGLGYSQKDAMGGSLSASLGYHSRMGLQSLHLNGELTKSKTIDGEQFKGSLYSHSSSISFAYPSVMPSMRTILTRKNFNVRLKVGTEILGSHGHTSIGGFYTESRIAEEDKVTTHPAYGMLYYQKANDNKKAMLDFNRLNDGVFTKNSPTIALPVYTYDVFSISGEGTGGSFRAYRGDLGYVRDEETKTREDAGTLGVEIGLGQVVHVGVNAEYVFTPSKTGSWDKNNLAKNSFDFKKSEGTYQAVYFKNPAEKAIPDIAYQNAIGGEDLVRLKLINQATGTPSVIPTLEKFNETKYKTADLPINNADATKKRDKRIQVITTLNAEEASRIGFDKKIYSYDPNQPGVIFGRCDGQGIKQIERFTGTKNYAGTDNYRKQNHISEIDVLGEDGRKYVYGLPVYNIKQTDVTFNVDNGNAATQQSTYAPGTDDTKDNQKGKDWYMEKQEMPAYTHSFLLTSLTSSNYVDVKGDGITEDDMGDAIKFNYSQFEKGIKWRTPTGENSASWSDGMKTDNKDDKGHYIYGEREQWYLYSVESKNMVARFYVANDRKDDKQALGPAGGMDNTWGSQRLTKISLFSKGDLVKLGNAAKPIKTVYFEYSYKLCKGVPGSIGGVGENGKLTLESVYFTYNGNEKQKKNKYKFSYGQNPDYDYTASDRWGSYKPRTDNPGGLDNGDYSYSIQDKVKADQYAAAWTLSQITLPSGGKINVEFEADDYAYVQDRKASSMYGIIGFGNTETPTVAQQTNTALYTKSEEFEYIYATVPYPITATTVSEQQRELAARYFNSKSSQLFMKLAVTMPSDTRGSGAELIPMYADIEKYGVIPNSGGQKIFIKVKKLESGSTPMVQYALQFIKNYLPFKAFPGYDVSEAGGLRSIIMALAGMRHNLQALTKGEDKVLKKEQKCKWVVSAKSFVRLTNPYYIKYGGGYRVKKIVLSDNWNKLSGGYDATYGQEYKYNTTELINGTVTTISSGVASWEPTIGGEENSHREILRYLNRNKGGPFDYSAAELPLAEMFFPSPSVGYSRVEVISIHRDTVKNAPGKTITEYFTTKDFPTKSDFTSLADGSANVQYQPKPILQLLKLDLKKSITVSQGFRVVLNDMNGKLKSQAAYSAFDFVNPISHTQNFYNVNKQSDNVYKFNHDFPTLGGADGVVSQQVIGREVEVMTDFREHKTETVSTNLNFNTDLFVVGIFPITIPTWFSPTFYESNTFRSASMLKVVNHYSILDSVVSIDKGSMVSTKNMVYDAETGNALVSRTNNEYNQPQYSFSYPAHWAYPGMGTAYKNIDAIYENLRFRNGLLETPMDMSVFESGDEIYVLSESDKGPLRNFLCDGFSGGLYLPKSQTNKIWAVYTGKSGSATPQMVFMDKDGVPYTADKVKMRIIRSGKRNLLGQGVGGVSTVNNPVREVGSVKKIVLDDVTGILQTSAASFKDHWRVDNALFKFDSVVQVQQYARVKQKTYTLVDAVSIYAKYNSKNSSWMTEPMVNLTPGSTLSYKEFVHGNALTEVQMMDSWLQFNSNADPLPAGAVLYDAKLRLGSHQENHSQMFPGANQVVGHSSFDPHYNRWGTLDTRDRIPNIVTIYRMNSPWPSGTQAQKEGLWKNIFKDANRDLHHWSNPFSVIQEIPMGGGRSNKNYLLTSTGDNRINLPLSSVQSLLSDAAAGRTTAIRTLVAREGFGASIIRGNKKGKWSFAQQCFNLSAAAGTLPGLQVYYYLCGDTTSVSPNPGLPVDVLLNKLIQCGIVTQQITQCRSKFLQRKSINPYVEGVWGNWRVDTSFVYYGDRKETDPAVPVDTRKGGLINNFKPFWNFSALSTALLQRNNAAADVWVWNSTITQYNRKGYEIENKDALGRFNAGLYGYNQQLPIAVANNSRYREIMFDGFEDYDYQTASCTETCTPRRNWMIENAALKITDTVKHTGRYSLRVEAGQSMSFKAPVTNEAEADRAYSMRVRIDSTSYTDTIVSSQGTGFTGKYYNYYCGSGWQYPNLDVLTNPLTRLNDKINMQCFSSSNACAGGTSYSCETGQPPAGINNNYYAVRWEGYIQPVTSGYHYFRTTADDGIKVTVNGVPLISRWSEGLYTNNSQAIYLLKGQLYNIKVDYFEVKKNSVAILQWKRPDMTGYELIPSTVVYPSTAAGNGTTNITTTWCTRLDSVQVRGNSLTDTLSLIKGRKMVVSAWVKEGGNDCKCSTYVKNSINVSFTGAANTYSLKPSGSIIEGWQRYESVLDIPQSATQVTVAMSNSSTNANVYFDDVRLHPFNSNLKSFVYHSSSLRLMSELDENNYASYYEYDDDGTLIRVKKETERGVKTITETKSALQKAEQ